MKYAIILAAAIAASPAFADTCARIGEFAESTMGARQSGAALSRVIAVTNDLPPLFRAIVLEAYEQPRYQSEMHKNREIQDFRNKWESACYRAKK
jgi:hypothetical protein